MQLTPDSYNTRHQAAWNEYIMAGGEGRFRAPERTAEELATRNVDGVEYIACTLLRKHSGNGVALNEWVSSLISDIAYANRLPLHVFERIADAGQTHDATIEDMEDRATLFLAYALVDHRLQGEDGAEQVQNLGFGISIVTSLAAAIVEYHETRLNILAMERI